MSDSSKFLSVDDIEQIDDIKIIRREVPEWEGHILLGSLPSDAMIEWAEASDGLAKKTAGLRLIVKSMVNEKGERIGTDRHLQVLRKKSAVVCNRIIDDIIKLNGLNKKAEAEIKNDLSEADTDASHTVLH
jgi:hypothetical protein